MSAGAYLDSTRLVVPGVSGNEGFTPYFAIPGDIDVRVKVRLADWTPAVAVCLVSRNIDLIFQVLDNGKLHFYSFFPAITSSPSTASTGLSDGSIGWIRFTRTASTGVIKYWVAAGDDAFASTDDVAEGHRWTQLGTDVTATSGALNDTPDHDWTFGSNPFYGIYQPSSIYRVQVRTAINGTIACDSIFENQFAGATTFVEASSNARTVTINSTDPTSFYPSAKRDHAAIRPGDQLTGQFGGTGEISPNGNIALSTTASLDFSGAVAFLENVVTDSSTFSGDVPADCPEGDYYVLIEDGDSQSSSLVAYSHGYAFDNPTLYVSETRPDSFGSSVVGHRIVNGADNVLLLGDSTTSTQVGMTFDAITTTWTVAKWRGFSSQAFYEGGGIGYSNWATSSTSGGKTDEFTVERTFETGGEDSSGPTPDALDHYRMYNTENMFGSDAVITAPSTPGENDVFALVWTPNGAFATTFDNLSTVKGFAVIGSNPNGISSYEVVGHNAVSTFESSGVKTAVAGSLTFTRAEVSLGSRSYSGGGLSLAVRPTTGSTPGSSENLIVAAVGLDSGGNGISLHTIAYGGKTAQFFASPTVVTPSSWAGQLAALNITLMYLDIGINDSGNRNKAEFKANLQTIIDNCMAADPEMRFLLLSEYEVTNNAKTLSQYSSAMYELAQDDPDRRLFIDTFSLTGAYAVLAAEFIRTGGVTGGPYIHDGIHFEHPAGDLRFQQNIADLIVANSEAVEPVFPDPADVRTGVTYGPTSNLVGAYADSLFLVATNPASGAARKGGVESAYVRAEDAAQAAKLARKLAEGGSRAVWEDATVSNSMVAPTVEGWTFVFGLTSNFSSIGVPSTKWDGKNLTLNPSFYQVQIAVTGLPGESVQDFGLRCADEMVAAGVANVTVESDNGLRINFDNLAGGDSAYAYYVVPPRDLFVINPKQTDDYFEDYESGDYEWFPNPMISAHEPTYITFDVDYVVPAKLITSEN